ncbi:MAG: sulfatase-like hydrolase/transferase [Chloroflexi bacterium]|nr:sulfatase-like hydrolase/transferase [Chloroflexota bacterium]
MPDSRPNIILIITDQQRYETIGALGFPHVETPNLDRLVREGVSFSHCFINAPSCGPARASLFTGYSPHNHGAQRNNDPWPRTWVESLRDSGYHCVNIGKMHADPYGGRHGFHERQVVENKQRRAAEVQWAGNRHVFNDELDKALWARGHTRLEKDYFRTLPEFETSLGAYDWHLDDDLHPDFFVGDLALRWLAQAPPMDDEPLFLQIGFPGPHPPYDPIKRYAEPYMDRDLPVLPVTQEEMDAQPEAVKALRDAHVRRDADSVAFRPDAPMSRRRRQRAYYLANMTMIDEKVGQILDALEDRGQLENSVVIFTSDHGDCLGDHGLSQKWNMYDASVRVPLIFWSPGRFEGGRTVDSLQQLFDAGPTILELAGIEPPAGFEAVSLLPDLEGRENPSPREYVYSEHARDTVNEGVEFEMMIRSKEWKLVEFFDPSGGQLFDLVNDPDELNDLWNDPAHDAIKQHLREVMHTWFVTSTTRAAGWRNEPRYG